MQGPSNCPQPLVRLEAVLVRQQGTEALICQEESGSFDGQACQEAVMASWKRPYGQPASHFGIDL